MRDDRTDHSGIYPAVKMVLPMPVADPFQDRPLQLLTITDMTPALSSTAAPEVENKIRKKIVFIMGRIHASEAPSSFIMQVNKFSL